MFPAELINDKLNFLHSNFIYFFLFFYILFQVFGLLDSVPTF